MPAIPVPQPAGPGRLRRATARAAELIRGPMPWRDALLIMIVLCGALWAVEIVDTSGNFHLVQDGLRPRDVDGLVGVVTAPFLHAGFGHLLANSAPFIAIGWVVLLSGVRAFALSSAIIIVAGGLATWLVAPGVGPHGSIVGASGLIMGWLGYLLGRAYFARKVLWIITAVLVVFFFGTLFAGLLPSGNRDVSWQGHLAGFAAGILAAWVMHPRRKRPIRGADTPPGSTLAPEALS